MVRTNCEVGAYRIFKHICIISKFLSNKVMKKAFLAFFAAAMMAACSQSEKGWVINGVVEGIEDGDTVFMHEGDYNDYGTLISSTIVKDGKFELKGAPMGCKPISLVVNHAGEGIADFSLFVEDNVLSVVLRPGNDEGTVEGGGENQRMLSEYRETLSKYMDQLNGLAPNLNDSTLEEAKRAEIQQNMDSLSNTLDSVAIKFIIDKMPSEFSNAAFASPAHFLPKEKIQPLLDAFAEKQPDASNYKKYLEENK